jgi:hypothetical protein
LADVSSLLALASKAFAELRKAVKTIFLCRFLHEDDLRREINEGLNVIEQWNGANDFVFFARRGEMTSNRHEDHKISMLALHLLQNCMRSIPAGETDHILSGMSKRPLTAEDLKLSARLGKKSTDECYETSLYRHPCR